MALWQDTAEESWHALLPGAFAPDLDVVCQVALAPVHVPHCCKQRVAEGAVKLRAVQELVRHRE
jgi:hypothetical protein